MCKVIIYAWSAMHWANVPHKGQGSTWLLKGLITTADFFERRVSVTSVTSVTLPADSCFVVGRWCFHTW